MRQFFLIIIYIVAAGGSVWGQSLKNELTQELINSTKNHYYEIIEPHDLKGRSLAFPEGSVLCFRGGSISNGTIIGKRLVIEAPACQVFNNTNLQASIASPMVMPEWFGAKADGKQDCTEAFEQAIKIGGQVRLSKGTYLIKHRLVLSNNVQIKGCGSFDGNDATRLVFSVPDSEYAISISEKENFVKGQIVSIEDLIIEPSNWNAHQGGGIELTRPVYMRNVVVRRFKKTNLFAHHDKTSEGPYNSVIESCKFMQSGEHGVIVGRGGNSMVFIGCMFLFNGAQKYNDWVKTAGNCDGLFVSGRDKNGSDKEGLSYCGYTDNGRFPQYSIENLTIVGGTASHNSRYGWNISDLSNSTLTIGYAEKNLGGKQMFIGDYVHDCTFFVNNLPVNEIERRGNYSRRRNVLFTQGRPFDTSNNDNYYGGTALRKLQGHIDEPLNSKIILMETEAGTISLVPDYENNTLKVQVLGKMKIEMPNPENMTDKSNNLSGTFKNRPRSLGLPIGTSYFCIDRTSPQSEGKGVVIYYAGNDQWVDALGRTIK